MTLRSYRRFDLAENQLKTAIALFVSGGDRFSVISLAGAADVLLARLAVNNGQENFLQSLLRRALERGKQVGTLEFHGREMNDALFINQIKHMDDDDDGIIELDPDECALGAILKAIVNYNRLAGEPNDLNSGFKVWMRLNLDLAKYTTNKDSD